MQALNWLSILLMVFLIVFQFVDIFSDKGKFPAKVQKCIIIIILCFSIIFYNIKPLVNP